MRTESQLIQAIASAGSLAEQASLVAELDALKASRARTASLDSEIDLGSTIVEATLTPVAVHTMHTAATDWLDDVTMTTEADLKTATNAMAAEAALWFNRTSADVRADHEEFGEQARGMARRLAGKYGEQAPAAAQAFLDYASFLHRREAASGLDQVQQLIDGNNQPKRTELPAETFDTFNQPVADMNAGVDEMQTSENAPLLNEILSNPGFPGAGQAEVEGGHSDTQQFTGPQTDGTGNPVGQFTGAAIVREPFAHPCPSCGGTTSKVHMGSDASKSGVQCNDSRGVGCGARNTRIPVHQFPTKSDGLSLSGSLIDPPSVALGYTMNMDDFRRQAAAEADPEPRPFSVEADLLDSTKCVGCGHSATSHQGSIHDPCKGEGCDCSKTAREVLHDNKKTSAHLAASGYSEDLPSHLTNEHYYDNLDDEGRKAYDRLNHQPGEHGPNAPTHQPVHYTKPFDTHRHDKDGNPHAHGSRVVVSRVVEGASGLPQVQQQTDVHDQVAPMPMPTDVMFPLIGPFAQQESTNGTGEAQPVEPLPGQGEGPKRQGSLEKTADEWTEPPGNVGSANPLTGETANGAPGSAEEPTNAMDKALKHGVRKTASEGSPEFRKGFGFAANWTPNQPLVKKGSAEFEAGLFAGMRENTEAAQTAWIDRHEARGGAFARRIAVARKYAATTTDLDTMVPGASPDAGGNTPLNGPGTTPPLAGGQDAAAPGGASPYNGADPYGSPVAPDPLLPIGNNTAYDLGGRAMAFRQKVQAGVLAESQS